MEQDLNHPVYSQPVLEFVTVASEYCIFVEAAADISKRDFISKAQKIMSFLYLKAAMLPKLDSVFEDANEKFVTEDHWIYVKNVVQEKLGSHEQFMSVVSEETQSSDNMASVSISEAFADVYQDLKDFIALYQLGVTENMNDALWECQMNFEQFWGQRIISSLSVLHTVFYGGDDLTDEELKKDEEGEKPNTENWLFSKRQEDWGYNVPDEL